MRTRRRKVRVRAVVLAIAMLPDARAVRATLTTSGSEASRAARASLERGLAELRRPGLEVELEYRERAIAGTLNDPLLVERSGAAARGVLGERAVREAQSISTIFSEDFGSFQQEAPGVMYFLGVSNPGRGWVGMHHTPTYVADEEAIFAGAETMAAVFLDLLRQPLWADCLPLEPSRRNVERFRPARPPRISCSEAPARE